MSSLARKQSMLGFEQTLMYGHYKEDLAEFARSHAAKLSRLNKRDERRSRLPGGKLFVPQLTACCSVIWKYTFAKIGEDWLFLALMGIIMAILSFVMDFFIVQCQKSRMWLYAELLGNNLALKFVGWSVIPMLLILFSAGFAHIVSPQAIGSGIPEMKTVLRGVILHEYLTFRTLVAKVVGLTCTLGSGLPLGKEGPFVHVASIVATLLSKLVTSFQGIYDNESRTGEMLAAACAVGVAATFYSPIGGVLFSIEVTSVFFAVRNYWRGFFAACCGATVWRLFAVWFKNEEAITALFKTSFRSDFPFDPQELFVFALIGVLCGFGGAGYVKFHRQIVHFFRNHKRLNAFLQSNRFIYPGLVTFILLIVSFPPFLGKYMAATLSNHDTIEDLFSNVTWGASTNDSTRLKMVKHWSTDHTSIYVNLTIYVLMTTWMSLIASTIPVPSGTFIPVFKIGAAFGRLVGELMVLFFPLGVPFGGSTNPIVPGGYAVVGAAAFAGAVTHTISVSVIVFELTGQMTHIIPVIISVLIANAISQTLDLNIYDSIIQIKKLPFLPPILTTSSSAHNIYVEDIMVRDVVCIWRNCTYRDVKAVLAGHPTLQSFPLVDNGLNMILLGSIQRDQLALLSHSRLSRERRLQEVRRRYSIQDALALTPPDPTENGGGQSIKMSTVHYESLPRDINARKMSRFEVTPVGFGKQTMSAGGGIESGSGVKSPKSILKQTISFTYSPNATVTALSAQADSRLRQAFENIFLKSLKLQDANPDKNKQQPVQTPPSSYHRRVQLPRERVIDMSPEEQLAWEEEQLNSMVDFNECTIDPAPFQLVERTTLLKVHSLFSMLGLSHAYVTSIGRLVGVVALKDLRMGIEKMNAGLLAPKHSPDSTYIHSLDCDPQYEDTLTSLATNDSEINSSKEHSDKD
ncbi:PREDICTED: chloride channel protein 2-like [Rhagoletis zephyria]|uniref:chloride channel protein 2-like n=1 Tax=Rhagoletis zephyria TaxID=28612 RepID=UPI0008113263|nr:PREDICTED: chloride channel protein 2-like [Rhagoletis zephyria]